LGEGIDVRLLNKGVSTIIQIKLLLKLVEKDLKEKNGYAAAKGLKRKNI
jgi:hypothetical protein